MLFYHANFRPSLDMRRARECTWRRYIYHSAFDTDVKSSLLPRNNTAGIITLTTVAGWHLAREPNSKQGSKLLHNASMLEDQCILRFDNVKRRSTSCTITECYRRCEIKRQEITYRPAIKDEIAARGAAGVRGVKFLRTVTQSTLSASQNTPRGKVLCKLIT
jgi:hypothetical protein